MHNHKIETANKQIRAVTYLGVVINVLLSLIKIVVGTLAGSSALIADGVHSISDMATDLVVLWGVYLGSKEPDVEHPYGHGRTETFSALFIAAALVAVGWLMIHRASLSIARFNFGITEPEDIRSSVIWVAISSVVLKEFLYRVNQKIALKTDSSALYANAWHHRSDALSSIAVIIGYGSMKFGYVHGDDVATIAVGLMIIMVGVKIIGGCLHEFSERSVDSKTFKQIEGIISSESRIRQWHNLRTRSVGREIFLDLHILVDPELNITQAHEIAESLEEAMHSEMSRPINITVHIEPDNPELRK